MRLSIVIPVYNVERFIKDTLDSIYNQETNEELYEVIIVNDGTPDGSMDIVDRFVGAHSNISVINQKNQGLSAARNAGMRIAKGDYIWVVDSDDSITKHSISEALHEIGLYPDMDMFCFDLYEQRECVSTPTTLFTKECYSKYYGKIHDGFFYCRKLPTGVAQRFLFRRKFLQQNCLEFTFGIYHEDQDFLIRCYTKARHIMPLRRLWYNYNIRESNSITSTFRIKRFDDILWIIKNFRELSNASYDYKEMTIWEEGVFGLSYGLLISSYRSNPEYKVFLNENKRQLKSLLFSSYLKSMRKNSLGKTCRLIKGLVSAL